MTKYEEAAVAVIAKVIQKEAEFNFARHDFSDDDPPFPVDDEYIKVAKDKLFKILDDLMNPPANWS